MSPPRRCRCRRCGRARCRPMPLTARCQCRHRQPPPARRSPSHSHLLSPLSRAQPAGLHPSRPRGQGMRGRAQHAETWPEAAAGKTPAARPLITSVGTAANWVLSGLRSVSRSTACSALALRERQKRHQLAVARLALLGAPQRSQQARRRRQSMAVCCWPLTFNNNDRLAQIFWSSPLKNHKFLFTGSCIGDEGASERACLLLLEHAGANPAKK